MNNAIYHRGSAYQKFFRERAGCQKFKSKYNSHKSYKGYLHKISHEILCENQVIVSENYFMPAASCAPFVAIKMLVQRICQYGNGYVQNVAQSMTGISTLQGIYWQRD